MDLQTASSVLSLQEYIVAYKAALWALRRMLELGVAIPDPHPYNLSMEAVGGRAVPCDFGLLMPSSGCEIVFRKSQTCLIFQNLFSLPEVAGCDG